MIHILLQVINLHINYIVLVIIVLVIYHLDFTVKHFMYNTVRCSLLSLFKVMTHCYLWLKFYLFSLF